MCQWLRGTEAQDLVEIFERIYGSERANDDLPWREALKSPVQLSEPQEARSTRIPVSEPPKPKEDDEKDLVWDDEAELS